MTHLQAHSAADHTDVTRQKWLPVRLIQGLTNDAGGNAVVGTIPDGTIVVSLADAATQGITFLEQVPNDYASGAISYTMYWTPSATDAGSNAVRWSTNVLEVAAGTAVSTAGTTTAWTGTASAKTLAQLQIESAQQLIASSTAGRLLRVSIRRLGADAADTYVGAVNVVGVMLSYTASQ